MNDYYPDPDEQQMILMSLHEDCPRCGGYGRVFWNDTGKTRRCPACDGKGYRNTPLGNKRTIRVLNRP